MAGRVCPDCQALLSSAEIEEGYCDSCGLKLPVKRPKPIDDLEPEEEDEPRSSKRKAQLKKKASSDSPEELIKQAKKQASTTLFTVAGLMLVCGTIGVLVLGNQQGAAIEETVVAVVIVVAMALGFTGLGVWAMFQPMPPAIIGLVLFVGISILDIVGDPAAVGRGIILRIIIIVMLCKAIGAASKASKLAPKKRYEDEYED